jgi:hypothetical protein
MNLILTYSHIQAYMYCIPFCPWEGVKGLLLDGDVMGNAQSPADGIAQTV